MLIIAVHGRRAPEKKDKNNNKKSYKIINIVSKRLVTEAFEPKSEIEMRQVFRSMDFTTFLDIFGNQFYCNYSCYF